MSRLQLKLVTWGLTAFYSVVAVLGYSLHFFSGCDASNCGIEASQASDYLTESNRPDSEHGSCRHHGHSIPSGCADAGNQHEGDQHGGRNHSPAFSSHNLGHDPYACPICALLAQFKVGYVVASAPDVLSQPPVEFTSKCDSAFYEVSIRLADARGPPCQVVSARA